MSNKKRVPKAEYFRMRYQNAVENNLTEKAEYFKSRLISMGKWEVVQDEDFPYISDGIEVKSDKIGGVTRHEITTKGSKESMVWFSC